MKKNRNRIFMLVFIAGLISSVLLSISEPSEICGADAGCEIVQCSVYASTCGIKNSDYGVVIFSFLILISLWQIYKPTKNKERMINWAIITGSVIAIYFIYIQKFVLGAWCKYCLVADVALLIALSVLILIWKK